MCIYVYNKYFKPSSYAVITIPFYNQNLKPLFALCLFVVSSCLSLSGFSDPLMPQSSRHLGQSADSIPLPLGQRQSGGRRGRPQYLTRKERLLQTFTTALLSCYKTLYTESFSLQEQHKTKHRSMIQMIIYI